MGDGVTDRVHVPNDNRYGGRARPARLIVLHTTQSPANAGRAVAVAKYLARPDVRASAHYVVDAATIVTQVAVEDTAWAAPGANADGVQVEQCSYAEWGDAEWAAPDARQMLLNAAQVLAEVHAATGIPLTLLSNAELAAGHAGVIGHVQASEVYQASDHWDPGPDYPYDLVVGWAAELAGTSGAASTTPPTPAIDPLEDDDMLRLVIQKGTPADYKPRHADGTHFAVDGVHAYPIADPYSVEVMWLHGVLMRPEDMAARQFVYETDARSIEATYQIMPVLEGLPDS